MGNTYSDSGYGDIMKIDTTTAPEASHTMAKDDLRKMRDYQTMIKKVASEQNVDAAVIAAIISRESRAGRTLRNGCGTLSNGWGLMQVKCNPEGKWDSEEHLSQGTRILVDRIEGIRYKFPQWTREQQLKGGIAAYNVGVDHVHTPRSVDEYTTGGDYSSDVIARAQWYKNNGGF